MSGKLIMRVLQILVASLAVSPSVWAHSNLFHGQSFITGWLRPFTGVDHLLVMLGIGVWAVRCHGSLRITIPSLFLGFMVVGALLGGQFQNTFLIESLILASIVVTVLFFTGKLKISTPFIWAAVAVMGMAHGGAHGMEMVSGITPSAYFLGFLSATLVLHLSGMMAGHFAFRLIERADSRRA